MALSAPILGEVVGWRRWLAVSVGFTGVLIILQPGSAMFNSASILPVIAAFMMAVYGIMTRYAARQDAAQTSFWTAIAGGVSMLVIGPFFWQPPPGHDWWWMALLCLTGTGGHFLLIKALDSTNASTVSLLPICNSCLPRRLAFWCLATALIRCLSSAVQSLSARGFLHCNANERRSPDLASS